MKKIILLLLFVYPIISYTQTIKTDSLLFHEEAGVEFQWYPAGIMPMLSYNYFINGHNAITSRFGVNIANRHDWSGLNDFEKGSGWGGSVGYRHYFNPLQGGWVIGAKADLWGMQIDWKLKDANPPESGTSKTIVLQPSVEGGYLWNFGSGRWSIGAIGGVGQEINMKTSGKEVGQGGMWIVNFIASYRF